MSKLVESLLIKENEKRMKVEKELMEKRRILALRLVDKFNKIVEAKYNDVVEDLKVLEFENLISNLAVGGKVKTVEVVKEVPVEVVKEVVKKDTKRVNELESKVKNLELKVESTNDEKNKVVEELKAAQEEIAKLKAELLKMKEDKKEVKINIENTLKNNKTAKESDKKKVEENVSKTLEKAVKNAKKKESKDELNIIHTLRDRVIGEYKGIAFEAAIDMQGISIYDPQQWGLKAEIEKKLIDNNIIKKIRKIGDENRVENEIGLCHKIDDKKYEGYIVNRKGDVFLYVYNPSFVNEAGENGASCIKLDTYLKNPKAKRRSFHSKDVLGKIKKLIALHDNVVEETAKKLEDSKADNAVAAANLMASFFGGDIESSPVISKVETATTAKSNEEVIEEKAETSVSDFSMGDFSYGDIDNEELAEF